MFIIVFHLSQSSSDNMLGKKLLLLFSIEYLTTVFPEEKELVSYSGLKRGLLLLQANTVRALGTVIISILQMKKLRNRNCPKSHSSEWKWDKKI